MDSGIRNERRPAPSQRRRRQPQSRRRKKRSSPVGLIILAVVALVLLYSINLISVLGMGTPRFYSGISARSRSLIWRTAGS